MSVRHTACRHCGQDIEGHWPYRNGEWRDRGNNRYCPVWGGQIHSPVRICRGCGYPTAGTGRCGECARIAQTLDREYQQYRRSMR